MSEYRQNDASPDQPWPGSSPDAPRGEPDHSSILGIVIAWTLIITVVAWIVVLPSLMEDGEGEHDDRVAMVITELTGKYMVGAADVLGEQGRVAMRREIDTLLGAGSIGQRQRIVILHSELGDAGAAAKRLQKLNTLIATEEARDEPLELNEQQQRVQEILNKLYPDPEAAEPNRDSLSDDDRDFLRDELGWFGELALAPPDSASSNGRDAVLRPARRIILLAFGAMAFFAMLGVGGLVGLIVLIVFAARRRLAGGLSQRGLAPHSVYAETFAIWLIVFLALQWPASALAANQPEHQLFMMFIAFMLSLVALAWPLARGVKWEAVRRDIGWTFGRRPAVEPLVGLAGYPMVVPLLAVGVMLMFVLMAIQAMMQSGSPGDPLMPDSAPAHPIIMEVAHGGMWQAIQLLLVAAVAAPIVEETMFRGVLYRHLRDATRNAGMEISIALSTLLNTFIFAIIHPQGWVAAPALMSLAVMFTILREWRGTVIPAMITHAVWNGVVMTLLLIALQS